jgi:hypothetical protein
MIDSFVLLAPVYLLGVIALLGFVGCGFTSGYLSPEGPILRCTANDQTVDLDWDPYPDATEYQVYRMDDPVNPTPLGGLVAAPGTTFSDSGLTNGQHYLYAVKAHFLDMDHTNWTSYSNTVDALPLGPFVKTVDPTLAGLGARNGFCGMRIQVGAADLHIYTLGRTVFGLTTAHAMKVVDGTAPHQERGNASVDPTSRQVGEFRYAKVIPTDPSAQYVTLSAGLVYYILSMEMATGGDQYYGRNTVVTTRPEAAVLSAVYADATVPGGYAEVAGAGNTIGPVSFQY